MAHEIRKKNKNKYKTETKITFCIKVSSAINFILSNIYERERGREGERREGERKRRGESDGKDKTANTQ